MSQETIAILGVGVSLLGAWGGLAALLISGQRGIRADLHALSDRVARLEGAFPFIAAAAARQAQADPPPAPPQ